MEKTIFGVLCCVYFLTHCYLSEQSTVEDAEPFRMRKVNLVWDKAKRSSLTNEQLNELFVELEIQDKDERKLKQQRTDGLDKEGEMEAVVRRNLDRIMGKYGLIKETMGESAGADNLHDRAENRVPPITKEKTHDERLDKLWSTAVEEEHFTKQELQELRRELDHHNEKWKQYNTLVNLVGEHEPNSINKKSKDDQETLDKLKDEMNIKQQAIDGNYQRLKRKVVLAGSEQVVFKDQRVQDLWRNAQSQIESPEELAIMKEELKHFDRRIAKHDDLRGQLDIAEDLLSEGHEQIRDKHDKLSAKLKEHRKYIKKMHATLSEKLQDHNEL